MDDDIRRKRPFSHPHSASSRRTSSVAVIDVPRRKRSARGKRRLLAVALLAAAMVATPVYLWLAPDAEPTPAAASAQADQTVPTARHGRRQKPPARAADAEAADTTATVTPVSEHPVTQIHCPANVERLGCNGRIGIFDAPQCPAGFHIDGASCAPN